MDRRDMLRLTKIDKSFGATRAVRSVSLDAAPGTVLGLVGENGAGKSTLIKIVGGAVLPDAGELWLNAQPIAPRNTHAALAHGIVAVFQELTLVRELTVEQNLLLTSAPVKPWLSIDRKRTRHDEGHSWSVSAGYRAQDAGWRPAPRPAADDRDRASRRA
ncbi:ATP-binding cassette domain-containing protein [Mesorhizobium sp. ASY16-5R]|uniref:ATP-binding cassette domain-containing protein n=1 Tax=Mesorhizobium sp. ASY16-5R TaxID=3445772 RepID=UPI003F9FA4B0